MYNILEKKIIPTYYNNDYGIPDKWVEIMKESIVTTAGKFSTSRMLVDYVQKLYMPLCDLTNKYYKDLENVAEYNEWKKKANYNWNKIQITQENVNNINNETIDAGHKVVVACKVKLPNLKKENIQVQVYCGQIMDNGKLENVTITNMDFKFEDEESKECVYGAEIELKTGGNFGYTFRVMPKHDMILDSENLNLVKWWKVEKNTEKTLKFYIKWSKMEEQ